VLVRLLVTLAGGFALIVLLAWAFQRRMVYLPLTQTVPAVETVLPGATEAVLRTADGLELGAWFLPAAAGPARRAVIVFNGNAGDRSYRAPLARALARAGFSVLLFDYRGYGGNPGRPSEAGLREDARAARRWLEERAEVDPAEVVYFGESLGCGVALALSAERPPLALVLRSPFPSLTEVGRWHYPFLPVRLLLRDRFECLDLGRRLACPLLVVAGEADRIVPASMSRRLYEAAPEPKRFVLVAGADHNDDALLDGERLAAETARFLADVRPYPKR
jgi:fermentation-respiration switch protein FrsA (DUF1100 family)